MTENKAVETLEYIKTFDGMDFGATKIALEMAIKALEEIQQYRALEKKLNGISVEQVVNAFIEEVEKETHEGYERGRILTNKEADDWDAYKAIGTIEEFKALKEKKSEWKYSRKENMATCKNCSYEHYLGTYHQYATNYCPNCGCEMEN